jgi:hypothetical protein
MNRLVKMAMMALLLASGLTLPSDVMAHGYYGPHVYGSVWIGPPAPYPVVYGGPPLGAIDMDVSPEETKVWVDGRYAGTCDDFDGWPSWLYLRPGTHQIRLQTPDGHVVSEKVRIRAGMKLNFDLDLKR